MKITTKLVLLNTVGIATFALLLGTIFVNVAAVKADAYDITENIVPTLATVPDINQNFAEARRQALLWASVGPADENAVKESFLAARTKLDKSLQAYDKAIELDSPEIKDQDRQLFNVVMETTKQWSALGDRLMTIEGNEAQVEFVRKVTSPAADKVFVAVSDLVKFNVDLGKRRSVEVGADLRTLYVAVTTIGAVGCIALLVIGFVISRSISQSLNRLQRETADIGSTLDFSRRFAAGSRDEIGATAVALNKLLTIVQQSLGTIADVSRNVGMRASELATNTQELSAANNMVSSSSSAMAAAVEEVTVSIAHVAERSQETRVLAQQAGDLAATGGMAITEAIDKVDRIAERANMTAQQVEALSQKAENISTVVTAIKEIAEQTNLLALNAAIEAARAGEVGRGFAVVADEVRKLAERTGTSTQEIARTIEQMQGEAQHTVTAIRLTVEEVAAGVSHVTSAGEVVAQIKGSAQAVLASVNDISDAMREQSMASNSMAQEIEKVAQMTEQTSANAQGTAEVGGQLHDYSQELLGVVARYKV
ncbi:methyl-accepting chemotaxis protein [Jeongeupia naejangsanensis]|uniref:Methyl-accepting chemotaxis protein n=1 Tax=Jeongeupia naejangsanensis TaxID=613195 RepID=A0ABS2BIC4_9NEIS|nr:methyl-accepting chemotaxis protein [Jeongeupia naejangsanensis]MBM3115365.1 methyl-accepting chemotaxis protein [Jeongeupia naejangsanensis]